MYVCNVCVSGQGLIHAGALVYLTDSLRSMKSPLDASYTTSTPKGGYRYICMYVHMYVCICMYE